MRSASLNLRSVTTNISARAVWLHPDTSTSITRVADDEFRQFIDNKIEGFRPPDVESRYLMSFGGRPELDTTDGKPTFGDIWEWKGAVRICTGDGEDFSIHYSSPYEKGYSVEHAGSFITLRDGEYEGKLPFITILKPINGVDIQNGVLVVQDGVEEKKYDEVAQRSIHRSIALGNISSAKAASANTISLDMATSGSNTFVEIQYMIVASSPETDGAPTIEGSSTGIVGPVYGATSDTFYRNSAWYKVNPPTAANTTYAVSQGSADDGIVLGVVSAEGVDQTTPVVDNNLSHGSGDTATATVTIGSGQVGISSCITGRVATATNDDAAWSQTGLAFGVAAAGGTKSTTASSMTFTQSGGTGVTNNWAAGAIVIAPSGGGATAFVPLVGEGGLGGMRLAGTGGGLAG